MSTLEYIFGGILVVVSWIMIAVVLFQKERARTNQNVFDDSAETYYGKNSKFSREARMERFTKISAALFFLLSIAISAIIVFTK